MGGDFNIPDTDMHQHLCAAYTLFQLFPFGPTCSTPQGSSALDYFIGSSAIGHRLSSTGQVRTECPTHAGLRLHILRHAPAPEHILQRPGTPPRQGGLWPPVGAPGRLVAAPHWHRHPPHGGTHHVCTPAGRLSAAHAAVRRTLAHLVPASR
jgi:hypothetical protein